jgi:endonuclease/exonuclease/phosphatase family metal-dependent hydrolase
VVCQEVDSSTGRSASYYGKRTDYIKELATKTGLHGYFGKAMDYDGGGYGEGLLSKDPVAAKVVLLPNPAGGEPRSVIYAETTLKNGRKVVVAGTHFCHQYEENRLAQGGHINTLFSNSAAPVIVCGDFNFESTAAPYQVMKKQWKDVAVIKGNPQNTFSSDKPGKRIDYAFVSKTAAWKIVDVEIFPVDYSDHMPVLFTLELK